MIDLAQIFHCALSTIKSIILSMVLIIHKNANITQKDFYPKNELNIYFSK